MNHNEPIPNPDPTIRYILAKLAELEKTKD